MLDEKRPLKEMVGKMVVTKEGRRIGLIQDITFETRTGELIQLVLKSPTPFAQNLNIERSGAGELLIPHNSIIAVGDFVVVSEEDLV
ncbi:MAG: PRC-barrel domain-containing protein [Candidatus Pacearchaeota archaeon]|jgi:sporulation protein YlmC with PRC-barrel domain